MSGLASWALAGAVLLAPGLGAVLVAMGLGVLL